MNRYIKAICKEIGITDIVNLYRRGANKRMERYKAVIMHTARRSFATNVVISQEYDRYEVGKMMGHKNVQMTIDNYILVGIIPKCAPVSYFN